MSKKRHAKLSKRHRRDVIRDEYGRFVPKKGKPARKQYPSRSFHDRYGTEYE